MTTDLEARLADGRTLSVHETGPAPNLDPADPGDATAAADRASFALFWHNGSPHTGALLPPLVEMTRNRGIRLVTYARPSYGGSTPQPGRNVASAAGDVAAIADALGIGRFAVAGASGGGPHALACAGLLPDRVFGVVTLAGVAPFTDDFDWFAGMASPAALRAARQGREARARFAEIDEFDETVFTKADWAALAAEWSPLGADAGKAETVGPDGLIDDDVAFASDWGFDLSRIAAPVLVVQGGEDRMIPPAHAQHLLRSIPFAELWLRPRDGHVSVLRALPVALDWLTAQLAT